MLALSSHKLISLAVGCAATMLLVVAGCSEEATGSCVVVDSPDAYCLEDKDDGYCSGAGYTFHKDRSCSAVGYAFYCTPSEMRESGSTIYGSARYLRSSTCDAKKGASGSGTSSSGGGSSSGTSGGSSGSSGTSSSGGSSSGSSGNNGDDIPQTCNTQTVGDCTMTFCAGGGQGCYYVANGSKFQCASCSDTTDCVNDAAQACNGN